MSHNKIYLYPVWIRFWHLFNALLCLGLIITGINMQYTSTDFQMFGFVWSVRIHNICGITLSVVYIVFLFGNFFTKNGNFYKVEIKGYVDRLLKQVNYYTFGIFKKEKAPFPISEERKFNPLQQFTYIAMMYLSVPLIIVTGWLMLYPDVLVHRKLGFNVLLLTDLAHICFGFFISMFLIIHVYFCTIGVTKLSSFQSMIDGWHQSHD